MAHIHKPHHPAVPNAWQVTYAPLGWNKTFKTCDMRSYATVGPWKSLGSAGLKVQTFTEGCRFHSYCSGQCQPSNYSFNYDTLNVEKIAIPDTDFAWQAEKAPVSSDISLVQCGLLQGSRALPQSISGRLTSASNFPI